MLVTGGALPQATVVTQEKRSYAAVASADELHAQIDVRPPRHAQHGGRLQRTTADQCDQTATPDLLGVVVRVCMQWQSSCFLSAAGAGNRVHACDGSCSDGRSDVRSLQNLGQYGLAAAARQPPGARRERAPLR
jgi:hypothetical protein